MSDPLHIPAPEFCRLCNIERNRRKAYLKQLTVPFYIVLGGISLVRWERPWSAHTEMALPLEYETKKAQKKWKGRLF